MDLPHEQYSDIKQTLIKKNNENNKLGTNKTRKKAELLGFMKAFKLLEQKLEIK